jgi:ornithine cyclodeaminase/alanine dehydrogenase-like protein (mu-crystallin family)
MGATAKSLGVMGAKVYSSSRKGPPQFLVPLFDGKSGALLALIQADHLGQVRTGAASGIATKYMSRPDSAELGIYGSGQQARTQVEAICKVRKIRRVSVFSPNEERRKAFAEEMSQRCEVEVVPVSRPEQAAEDKDIIVTATSSREPVLRGDWLSAGQQIYLIGSIMLTKAEADVEVFRRATLVAVDSKDQAKLEAGDFVAALDAGVLEWSDIYDYALVHVGKYPGRESAEDVTVFKSLGLGIEDIALAARVVELSQGLGRKILD